MTEATTGWALVDGRAMPLAEASIPVTDVGFTHGYSVFETLLAIPGRDPAQNLARLRLSGSAAGIDVPSDALLQHEIAAVAEELGGRAVVRITITGDGRRVVWATPIDQARWNRAVRCITGEHRDDAFVDGSVKHRSRMGWMLSVRQAGGDEMLLVDHRGRFTEGTSCAVLAVVSGAVHTAAWDRRILRSTTLERLLEHAERLSIPIVREGASAAGPFDALYVASTTRGIAPVVELDGQALPGWDPVGEKLREADTLS